MDKKREKLINRWYKISLFIIIISIISTVKWICDLKDKVELLEFENKIFKIYLSDKDSLIIEKNHIIDSLGRKFEYHLPIVLTELNQKDKKNKNIIVKDTIVSDTLPVENTIYSDSLFIINDTLNK